MEEKHGKKMRVLVFVPEFPRLTETFIQREISKLIELNNLDITVFSLEKAPGKTLDNVAGSVVYKRLTFKDALIAWIFFTFTKPVVLFKTIRDFMRDSLKEGFGINKIMFLAKSVGYAYLFRQHSPDHIHANFMSWPSTMAMLISKILGIPYSISAHAKDVMVEGEYFAPKVLSAKFVSICNRFAYEDCIKRSGIKDPKNVLLQYHGIDSVQSFESIAPAKRSGKLFVFNGGSRLVEKKGQKYLIEAAKILKDFGLEFEVHIAGPGPLFGELVSQIDSLGLADHVFIHGNGDGVPFDKVVSLLKACDIVAQSNINLDSGDADGIPTFVIEAAMLAKPIVTTNAGSIEELIIDGKTGWVVPQRDPMALSQGILRAKEFIDFKRSLGEVNFQGKAGQDMVANTFIPPKEFVDITLEAQKKALEMFDLDKNIRELEQLLIQ
ncbi:MAG TPA: glycosyltransferase family 4 protein [bacterium]|nr:glycosyltransferase family 4 protein [bacterium]